MISTRPQTTIARPARIDGFGYWSGQPVSVEFRPAPVDSGIVFARTVGDQTTNIPANLAFRVDTPRRTSIERDGVRVEMVEHLMSALYALKIDNCLIVTSATELPADDGSCHVAAEALTAAGIVEQGCTRSVIEIESTCRVGDDQAWIEASPNPQGGLVIEYRLDYGPGNVIGAQQFAFALNEGDFLQEVAPARTFVLEEEAIRFRQLGYGQHMSYQDLLVFGPDGPIDNELRFSNECARHKTLDLIGDLALAGADINAHIVAYRSGHRLNARLGETIIATHQSTAPGVKTDGPRTKVRA